MSQHYTPTIKELIEKHQYKSYLEIGLCQLENFNQIECERKVGVDPVLDKETDITLRLTSDEFFTQNTETFDCIFIDGLHHADQVERDIVNAYKVLNNGGTILIHDIKPSSYIAQVVPMPITDFWNGDVWRAWFGLKKTKLTLEYIEETNGLGVIKKSKQPIPKRFVDYQTPWEEYNATKGWLV